MIINMYFWIVFSYLCFDFASSVQVSFDKADSGFFFKHSSIQPQQQLLNNPITDLKNTQASSKENKDSVLSFNRFTVAQANHPVSIRASYGPFSTKQTVPARYIVPEDSDNFGYQTKSDGKVSYDIKQTTNYLDISASLVRNYIPRDSPVLRVLFHGATDAGVYLQRRKICILLHVTLDSHKPLRNHCMPDGDENVCVAEVVIPPDWWPKLSPPDKDGHTNTVKMPQPMVQVSYSVFEPPAKNPEQCEPKVQIQPATVFAQVPLTPALTAYKEHKVDNLLTFLIPHQPLYPLSKVHIPVFLQSKSAQNIAIFVVRARAKSGVKILGATATTDQWNVSFESENTKQTVARVTIFRNEQESESTSSPPSLDENEVLDIFSWLIEVENVTKENRDSAKIIWSVNFVQDAGRMQNYSSEVLTTMPFDGKRQKIIARFQIMKDDIQSILPIAKDRELMNTAVLTGRQVYKAMKVFIVSQSGKVADITLQSSCHSEDESVIKVSTSCSSVYVDGTETEGSSNASIVIKYGSNSGLARFTVWMPEYPLEVAVTDFRLSQIKGWKIPVDAKNEHHKEKRRKRANTWYKSSEELGNGSDKHTCRTRYQQTPVEVYARFIAVDQHSGRVSSYLTRKMALRITELVEPFIRVADPKIATLSGRILQGRTMGRTDVQVLSPINGRVIGSKEIRVGSDKVTISRLSVQVVTGLQLNINSDGILENGYIAETLVTRHLTAQYQEGLLDIDIEFSDGTKTPLRDVSADNYYLLVESLDTEVVAFAPMLASSYPRVIAVGEGNGDLLRVTLLLPEDCRAKRNNQFNKQAFKDAQGPLASTLASVQVDFNTAEFPDSPDTFQNDGVGSRDRKTNQDSNSLTDILIGIPYNDEKKPNGDSLSNRHGIFPLQHSSATSALEIGMYVLLSTFCFAIVVFVVSCFVYASKHKMMNFENNNKDRPVVGMTTAGNATSASGHFPILRESRKNRDSTTNAHNWVWLGRSTMDRSSMIRENNDHFVNPRDSKIRITRNPLPLNYMEAPDSIQQASTFDDISRINRDARFSIAGPSYSNTHEAPSHSEPSTSVNLRKHHHCRGLNRNEDYRPPVPPHRNIGITANVVRNNV
ncbi:transmembrane protein 132E [Sitodiplosis mosellana]|uniref:transmembrane protein 132E n=1 Tax=Sitodiplosis mosellana TaxID=263140 RepID=UPI002444C155|nr:transmembrane protein 132E [Sitodiplosis mosellana]XP_055322732.1 transmembrane protein 132E [Sitodiplosis mosellana]XP_055322733.1 transmembrane protein 132E [Sitodiplosis mosellana]